MADVEISPPSRKRVWVGEFELREIPMKIGIEGDGCFGVVGELQRREERGDLEGEGCFGGASAMADVEISPPNLKRRWKDRHDDRP